jgi:hypothetical protein
MRASAPLRRSYSELDKAAKRICKPHVLDCLHVHVEELVEQDVRAIFTVEPV